MDLQLSGKYYPRVAELGADKEPFSEDVFRRIYRYEPEIGPRLLDRVKDRAKCGKDTLYSLFPVVRWLSSYKKEDIIYDLMSGLTVAVMHIPQGMAYALLGGVPPIVGIYMAFFPVVVYILMGTSHHISMGTFAVVCMMSSKSVDRYSHGDFGLTPVEVATAITFVVGVWQILLGVLRLGSLSVFLSHTLISGFTTGAAIHVLTSQVKSLLGLSIKRYSGPFKIIFTYYDIFASLGSVNYMAVIMSACTIVSLVVYNEVVKPRLKRICRWNVPIPIELIIVVVGTLLSAGFDLKNQYGVAVVDDVPTGLPTPEVPPLEIIPNLLIDGLVISIVAVSINISMASIFAKKLNYKIDGNQEILASGAGNLFGSFFSCLPYAASLSRSLIQESVGGRTQMASAVSCVLLVFVLLFIAPFFEPLPYCILSSIIVVALKGMLLQFKDLSRIHRLSKLDGFVWVVTFVSVIVLDIDYGLGLGLVANFAAMIVRGQRPQVVTLGRIPGTETFADQRRYRSAQPIEGVVLLRVVGALTFANVDSVREQVFAAVVDHQKRSCLLIRNLMKPPRPLNLVLSMSSVPHVDPSAVHTLSSVCTDLTKMNVVCVLCEFVPTVYDAFAGCDFFDTFPSSNVFPTMTNAIDYVDRCRSPTIGTIFPA